MIHDHILRSHSGHIVRRDGRPWYTVRARLPEGAVRQHLNGGPRYGVDLMDEGGGLVWATALDFDDHAGAVGWETMAWRAGEVMDELGRHGVDVTPVRSLGGAGIHLWVVWSEGVEYVRVRALIEQCLGECWFSVGTRGVERSEVELYPKNHRGAGRIALPRDLVDPWDWELVEGGLDGYEWPVTRVDGVLWVDGGETEGGSVADGGSPLVTTTERRARIDELLAWVPVEGLGYDEWWVRVMAIKGAGGTKAQAEAWSRRDPAWSEEVIGDEKWASIGVGGEREREVGLGSLIRWAEEGGWEEVRRDDFPLVVSGEGDSDGELVDGGDWARVPGKGRWGGYKVASVEQVSQCLMSEWFPWDVWWDDFLQEKVVDARRLMDSDMVEMRAWFDRAHWEPVGAGLMRDAVERVCAHRRRNLAQEWSEGLVWDGVDRMEEFVRRLGDVDSSGEVGEYEIAVSRYMWTSHGARLVSPGYQADAILVLKGDQGTGKSQAIRAISPVIGGVDTYKNVVIDDLINGDRAARVLKGCLVANLDELRGFSKREQAEVKAALSRSRESYTPKYLETRHEYERTCMIYATTNEVAFLDDLSGNRRYHVLEAKKVDLDWLKENRDQLWAQGIAEFKSSGQAWKRALELVHDEQKEHEVADSIEEAVLVGLDGCESNEVLTRSIMTNWIGLALREQHAGVHRKVAQIMRRAGWVPVILTEGGVRLRGYRKEVL
jgi:hypothetical protein